MTDDRLDLDALEALEGAATPGPWITHDEDGVAYIGAPATGAHLVDYGVDVEQRHRDAAFIAAFRDAAPALISAVRGAERSGYVAERVRRLAAEGATDRAEAERDAAQAALARVEELLRAAHAMGWDTIAPSDVARAILGMSAVAGEGQGAGD